jgi:hypothetical protein
MASELEVGKLKVGDTHGEVTLNNTSGTSGSTVLSQTYNGGVAELRIGSNISTAATSAMNVITGDAGAVKFNGDVTVGVGGTGTDHTKVIVDGTNGANRGPRIEFKRNSVLKSIIGSESGIAGNSSDDLLIFSESGGVKIGAGGYSTRGLTVDSSGLATFSGGINLGDETLSEYNEGTFTPTLNFGGATTGITYSSPQGGVFTRIGRLCYVQIAFVLTSKGSATGNATISGLPFNAGDLITNTSIENSLSFSLFSGRSDAVASVSGTSVTIRNLSGDSLNQNNFTDTTSIRLCGCYALATS